MTAIELPLGSPVVHREHELCDGRLVRRLTIDGRVAEAELDPVGATDDPSGAWWRSYLAGRRPAIAPTEAAPLRSMELFCGPGGLALGFGQACAELGYPWRSVAAADTDEEAVEIYRRNHATEVVSSRSVSALVDYHVRGSRDSARFHYDPEMIDDDWERLVGGVDVVLAGPPCQGHSNLNNRTRRTDKRNELYLTVPAIAVAVGAPVVIIENVPAVVHDRSGVVATTIALLREAGYSVETGVVDAARLGWAQRRSRFFLVARLDRAPLPLDIVTAALSEPARPVMWALEGYEDVEDGFMTRGAELSDENISRIDWLFDNDAYDLALSERPDCHKEGTTYTSVYGRLHPDKPAPTITTGFMTPGRGRYIHPTRRRPITAREAARLQGFPDTYRFQPDASTSPSKAKLAKWIGDAVPMPLGHAAAIAALGRGPLPSPSSA